MAPVIDISRVEGIQLSGRELQRYARHLALPGIDLEGQRRLKAARVLCIGAGGLGSPIAIYLAAAGVGRIGIVDPDVVDLSNLQRQILHGTSDTGRSKLDSAIETLTELNPEVEIVPYPVRFIRGNAREIAEPYDIIVDGTDNFQTRYLSNDLAVLTGKPNVYGSIFRFEGQVSVFAPHLGGPCYRCLFPEPPDPGSAPSCAEGGVLGVLPGIVGSLQANETIKLILGLGEPLTGRLVHFDALAFRFREFRLRRDPACPVCGDSPTIRELIDYDAFCGLGRVAAGEERQSPIPEIDVHQLQTRIQEGRRFILLDVREPHEYEICRLPGAILIPLGRLPDRLDEIDRHAEIVVHCKSGIRSARAVQILTGHGFHRVCHVRGGIDAWSREIDESAPLY